MTPTRRAVLASGCAASAALAGCSLLSEPSQVDIQLYNYTSDSQMVRVELVQPGAADHSDADVLSRQFDIPAPADGESAGTHRAQDIAERQPYIVRALPKFGNGQTYHYHYFPGENTSAEDTGYIDLRLYRREVTDDVYVRFG